MEVHHPKSATHTKHWTGHLAEFFMLFLAVTLGFFAENYRERHIEREREEKYLQQLLIDLRQDTARIAFCLSFKTIKERQADSLLQLFHAPDMGLHTGLIYYYARLMPVREPFYGNEGTQRQLQNAGGLRMIHNDELVTLLNLYVTAKEKIYQIQEMQDFKSLYMMETASRILKSTVMNSMLDIHRNHAYRYQLRPPEGNPPLLRTDLPAVEEYCNALVSVMTSEKYEYVLLERLRTQALKLMSVIEHQLQTH